MCLPDILVKLLLAKDSFRATNSETLSVCLQKVSLLISQIFQHQLQNKQYARLWPLILFCFQLWMEAVHTPYSFIHPFIKMDTIFHA